MPQQEARQNYQHALEVILQQQPVKPQKLLLHSCCAPCSSYVLTYLSDYFEIFLLYYNPNIAPAAEYTRRFAEQERLIAALPTRYPVTLIAGTYQPDAFAVEIRGVENTPEGGVRCERCIAMRLREAAVFAGQLACDYFTTTLTISPHKNAPYINCIGNEIAAEVGIAFLPSDFKKRNGFRESVRLSEQYGLYRQDYCGCIYSQREAALRRQRKE